MLPVSRQYLNSPCEMRSMDGGLILQGSMSGLTDEGIEISGRGDRLPIVHCNTVARVNLFNSVLGFRALVGKVYLSTEEFLRVVELQNVADYEKRNFFRVKVDLACTAFPTGKSEGDVDRSFAVTVEDLSLGGLLLSCGKELSEGESLIVRLKLYGENLTLLCRVIRKRGGNGPEQGYGCEFLYNTGRQFDLICKYLFDCQREQIRIMKQMQP